MKEKGERRKEERWKKEETIEETTRILLFFNRKNAKSMAFLPEYFAPTVPWTLIDGCSNRSLTHSKLPAKHAKCKGVHPPCAVALMVACLSMSSCIRSGRPMYAAVWRGVSSSAVSWYWPKTNDIEKRNKLKERVVNRIEYRTKWAKIPDWRRIRAREYFGRHEIDGARGR